MPKTKRLKAEYEISLCQTENRSSIRESQSTTHYQGLTKKQFEKVEEYILKVLDLFQ